MHLLIMPLPCCAFNRGGRLIRVSGSQMLAGQPGVRAIDKINRRNRIGFYMGRMLTHEEADAVEEVCQSAVP